jgi:fused signal recognition particle receptor
MFDKLKEKLVGLKKNLGQTIEEKEKILPEIEETRIVDKKRKAGISEKAKALIFDQEFIIEEKALKDSLWQFELALLESDIALPVAEKMVGYVKEELVGKRRKVGTNTEKIVEDALRKALLKVVLVNGFDFDEFIKKNEKPINIVFVGVNGTGKTTTIAKIAERLKEQNYSVVIAAGDTFRAGAIEQIEKHAGNLGLKIIKSQPGGDPAAVVYDAVKYAKARHKDVVLADTAGRMHTNVNLMDQLKKICRVTPPNLVIFVDEAIAGNDAVERAKLFNEAVGFHGSILTKADADAKGGAAVSIAYATGKPILFLGVGQRYTDLMKFDPGWLVDRLFE